MEPRRCYGFTVLKKRIDNYANFIIENGLFSENGSCSLCLFRFAEDAFRFMKLNFLDNYQYICVLVGFYEVNFYESRKRISKINDNITFGDVSHDLVFGEYVTVEEVKQIYEH